MERPVMVIDPQGSVFGQLDQAASPGLRFRHVERIGDAMRLIGKQPCFVGLVAFDSVASPGVEEVERLIAAAPLTEWIALLPPDALASAPMQALVTGAFHDYHTLPADVPRLLVAIGHAAGKAGLRLRMDVRRQGDDGRFGILGASAAMKALFRRLERIVETDVPVLIGGETGTGKELVAQAIHRHSTRAGGPFVVVNCGALPENLIQSELFGHEKGAFTGAARRKIGSIEAASGGDLFLDEIGDLPLALQANLLRVLQEQKITRLGSTETIPVDFRVIAATHVDLQEAVRAGRFREDLYYRLNVVHLTLPPLRERGDDVCLLAEAILRRHAGSHSGCRSKGFSGEALRALRRYRWPGNVRELINRVHRAAILGDSRLIGAADLGLEAWLDTPPTLTLEDARAQVYRDVVLNSLRANANNVSRAARELGVSRVTVYRIINRHKLAMADWSGAGGSPGGLTTG